MQIKGNKKMKRIGIILTPDVRSNAYLSKLVDNKIKLDQIIFMNDNVERKNCAIYKLSIHSCLRATLEKK